MQKVVLYGLYRGRLHMPHWGIGGTVGDMVILNCVFLNSELKCLCSLEFFSYFVSIITKNKWIESNIVSLALHIFAMGFQFRGLVLVRLCEIDIVNGTSTEGQGQEFHISRLAPQFHNLRRI